MLATVPVAPVAELLVLGLAVAEDDRDYCLDFGRGMGPGGATDFAQIDGVELS